MRGAASFTGFLLAIVAANWLTSTYGLINVGFGQVATAGTYAAGITFVLRDAIDDTLGRLGVLAAIGCGAALSFVVAAPQIALASMVAFTLAEICDYLIYTPLRAHGYIRAALASNIAGAFVDTIVFLWIAGFPIWTSLPGQMIAKVAVTAIVVAAVLAVRAAQRDAVLR
jgi:hypothetical protein